MSTSVLATEPVNHRSARHRRRLLTALVASVATVTGPLVVAMAPAEAGPIDTGWSVTAGTDVVPGSVSDGSDSAASFSYDDQSAGFAPVSWDFTAVAANGATPGDPIKVPWTWQGLHAWFAVTAQLQPIVNGQPVETPETDKSGPIRTFLVNAGPQNCCTTPSNGFVFGNVATFTDVPAGATYGFRLTGSNGDFNNFLTGTFTLSTRPYIDATIGSDNRQWIGAEDLTTAGVDGKILEPGEARWYKFPVVPGQTATVTLPFPSQDYDIAVYGDIGAAFERLTLGDDLTQLAAASAAGAPGANTQVPTYPDEVKDVPTSGDTLPSTKFAPRVYAPRVYAPRVYAPRVYAPRVYAPRVYAPRVYAPNSYAPDLQADPSFRDAFSAAQNQTLLVVSVNSGAGEDGSETATASTGNTQGFYYVRVQGHDDKVFDTATPFHLGLAIDGIEDCIGLQSFATTPTLPPTASGRSAVIVTDTEKIGLGAADDERASYLQSLQDLALDTGGVVVDVDQSARVRALRQQVALKPRCPFATNLVAEAIKDIIDSYRNSSLQYVVLAGGDDVIPFFRYPDTAGLGPESQFEPPMRDDTPAGASLDNDQVLSQDAYGARTEVTIGGASVPVPDLAVGRLVKAPEEIAATIAHFLDLEDRTLPLTGAGRSLVTGYDFLEDAANRVNQEFSAALPGGDHDALVEPAGTPHEESWSDEELRAAMFDSKHDLVYLAGHFSANDTLAADFTGTVEADELALPENAGRFTDTLVLSAGCHSGYSIVDGEAGLGVNTQDWSQRFAQQHALLIGGTGYQYGDTDFLEYSERLYLGIAQRLREGPANGAPPVAIGKALALAKQDYLATLSTLQGIDQKAVLQATLYGLPMTGFDAPGRAPLDEEVSQATPLRSTSGPGQTLGLWTDQLEVDTPLDLPDGERQTKPAPEAAALGLGLPGELTWRNGLDGVSVQPGVPALPKQVVDVTVDDPELPDLVLRGVGFRNGTFHDESGLLPLTGAPAIEGSTGNTTFDSPAFFPQRLATANYFGALGDSGRTSLILTPTQYRNDPGFDTKPTNTERAYSHLGFRLFYSGSTSEEFGDNQPALAAPPAITDVSGAMGANGRVRFSVRATGDPSAGVQAVWVTWTGGPNAQGDGRWASVDLSQDPLDSTTWTGVLDESELPEGQLREDLRFVVQAANGAGAVGLDTADGDGYEVGVLADSETSVVQLSAGEPEQGSPLGVSARVTDAAGDIEPGRRVLFTVLQGGATVFDFDTSTDADGVALLGLPAGQGLPEGAFTVTAFIFDDLNLVSDFDTQEVDTARMTLSTGNAASPLGVVATVTNILGAPFEGRTVRWTVLRGGTKLYDVERQTGADGTVAAVGDALGVPAGPLTIRAELLDSAGEPIQTESVEVSVDGLVLTPTPTFLTALAGKAFGSGISVSVSDVRGPVMLAGLPVTFLLPGSNTTAGATFPGGLSSVIRNTNANGVATSPIPTARTKVGVFTARVSVAGATDVLVPMAAKYAMGKFGPPVNANAGAVNGGSGNLPLKWKTLLANGKAISDQEAAGLVAANRVQLRWRARGSTASWSARTGLASYDAGKDTLQINLKTTSLGMTKGTIYAVEVRILPATSDPKPAGYNATNSEFDLGRQGLLVKAEK